MSEPHAQRQIQLRPDWLPSGHAFCPGVHEKVGLRQFAGMPGVQQNYLECDHGSWSTLSDAWTAHALLRPAELAAAPPAPVKTTVVAGDLSEVEAELAAVEQAIAYLTKHRDALRRAYGREATD